MMIGAVSGSSQGQGMKPGKMGGRQDDPVAKGIQDKINQAQKELQELNGKKEMSPEQKQKKRQELQKEISDLNMQLRQHEMEVKMKEREEKRQAQENPLGLPENQNDAIKESRPGVEMGISAAGMEALISADGAKKTADAQGSVAQRMEGKANVLEMEIKLDSARNGDTSSKQEQLADVTSKAQAAQTAQMGTLRGVGEKLEEAADAEKDSRVQEHEEETEEGIVGVMREISGENVEEDEKSEE